jgi:hypothetical protein
LDEMIKLHPRPITVNGIKRVLLFASPNDCCWQCEQKLPPEPGAIAVEGLTPYGPTDFIYLTCSKDCQRALEPDITQAGLTPRYVEPAQITDLLRVSENVVGVVEGWQGVDRPYYLVRGPFFDEMKQPSHLTELVHQLHASGVIRCGQFVLVDDVFHDRGCPAVPAGTNLVCICNCEIVIGGQCYLFSDFVPPGASSIA